MRKIYVVETLILWYYFNKEAKYIGLNLKIFIEDFFICTWFNFYRLFLFFFFKFLDFLSVKYTLLHYMRDMIFFFFIWNCILNMHEHTLCNDMSKYNNLNTWFLKICLIYWKMLIFMYTNLRNCILKAKTELLHHLHNLEMSWDLVICQIN